MISTRITPLALALAVLAAASMPAGAVNLFTNSGFENPLVGYQLVPGGDSTSIPGWTTVLSGVEHFDATAWGGTPDGVMVVDLANYVYSTGGLLVAAGALRRTRFAA